MTQAFEVLIRGKEVPVIVQRNPRRRTRIGFSFQPDGVVKIDSPRSVTLAELKTLVVDHGRWVLNSLEKIATSEQRPPPTYQHGDLLSFLGDICHLEVVVDLRNSVTRQENRILVTTKTGTPEEVRKLLKKWYKNQAKPVFQQLLGDWERCLPWLNAASQESSGDDAVSTNWRQIFMRSQWGSCSSTGKISLNTHLIKVPFDLIDYVVLHELCHLKHLNHSRRFYNLMDSHMPGWKARRKRLNGYCEVLSEG